MHTGPIALPKILVSDSLSIIELAHMLGMFNIVMHIRALEVTKSLTKNELTIVDLQDLQKLSDALSTHILVDKQLQENIKQLYRIYALFIEAIAIPERSCGAWLSPLD